MKRDSLPSRERDLVALFRLPFLPGTKWGGCFRQCWWTVSNYAAAELEDSGSFLIQHQNLVMFASGSGRGPVRNAETLLS